MQSYRILALLALITTPAYASLDRAVEIDNAVPPVDRLYPEIAMDDDGWRALLPVILLDADAPARPSAPPSNRATTNGATRRNGG